jgi:uncharacterized membrane protein
MKKLTTGGYLLLLGLFLFVGGIFIAINPVQSQCGSDCVANDIVAMLMGAFVVVIGLVMLIIALKKLSRN